VTGETDTDADGAPNDCDADCITAGMTADTDDDGDGVLDTADAFPLISVTGETDTDADGAPNDCDADCITAGMTADTDDDGDGVADVDDAFPLGKQVVTSTPSTISIAKGSTDNFIMNGSYDTDPTGSVTTGLGIGIFFDSSKISFVSMSNAHSKAVFLVHDAPEDIQSDSSNDDNDESTDSYALISWADLTGANDFTAPSALFTVTFKPATDTYEGTTSINYSKFSPAAGYEVSAAPIIVTFLGE
jgi:hypothetical protein